MQTTDQPLHLRILGTRGVPAAHGGFETFAHHFALHMVRRDARVSVYCQHEEERPRLWEDVWEGVRRVNIAVPGSGPASACRFDWLCIRHAVKEPGLCLTLGYNTALFNIPLRLKGLTNVINMDGLEWKRDKWSLPVKAWFYVNERAGCLLGDHLVADHPAIADHLATRVPRAKITTIPYGAPALEDLPARALEEWGLVPGGYALVVARPEPENSILQVVEAFSRGDRGLRLVVLGNYHPGEKPYHRQVLDAAGPECLFPGAVYEPGRIQALRYHARLYIHGHTVGGTNPSLVEALGAGNPVLAHDNRFNRWVAGEQQCYFTDTDSCAQALDSLLDDRQRLDAMAAASRARHREHFTWERICQEYEDLVRDMAGEG